MAVDPLFWTAASGSNSRTELLRALRLGPNGEGSEAPESVAAVVDSELRAVRIGFFKRLGEARVASLVAIVWAENPTTSAGVMRLIAAQAEVLWLRIKLLRALPQLWMDASSRQLNTWNEDSFSRENSTISRERNIEALEEELEDLLASLVDDSLDSQSAFQATTIGPTDTTWAGEKVWGEVGARRLLPGPVCRMANVVEAPL